MKYEYEVWEEVMTDGSKHYTACVAYKQIFVVRRKWLKSKNWPITGFNYTLFDTVGYIRHKFHTKESALSMLDAIYVDELQFKENKRLSYQRVI